MSAASSYDAVVVGGGHNSLVAAATLARAGKRVRLLERTEQVGGTVATDEIHPGFRVPALFPSVELLHPSIRQELDLERLGLRLLRGRGGVVAPRPRGAPLELRSASEIDGGLSIADAEELVAFSRFLERLSRALEPLWVEPLPELESLASISGLGDALGLVRHALRLRRLGGKELGELLRYLPMSLRDVLDERFEDETLKAVLAGPGLLASWLAPRSAGSALGLLHHRPAWCGGLLAPPVFAEGGPGELSRALALAAEAAGAEISTVSEVVAIRVDGGRARAVELADGTSVEARAVVSGLDPRRTLLELAPTCWLEPEHLLELRSLRARGTVSIVTFALDSLPELRAEQPVDLSGRLHLGPSMDDLERAFDANKYGELPERPWCDVTFPSLVDPELAPAGKHVAVAWTQYTPYALRQGSWDEARERLGDRVCELLEEHLPGFTQRVLARRVLTPVDLETRFGLTGGCPYHAEMALDQLLFLRPIPGWYRHRTPIDGLYLCGPGTHPGGGVTGLPGRSAARVVLRGS